MFYRARWYDPQIGRFISEDPIGLAGGINQFAYVGNSPQNATDPSGLYEIDVHYYLTYFIASKFHCLTRDEVRLIANADQGTDEDPATMPSAGLTQRQREINAKYHALHEGSHQPYLDNLWNSAMVGKANYVGFGRYLHYRQDMFSHAAYPNSVYGHLFSPLHAADKTRNDVGKAAEMAAATWFAIRDWIRAKKCNCGDEGDTNIGDWWPQVIKFLEAYGGTDDTDIGDEINAAYLREKIRILNVPPR